MKEKSTALIILIIVILVGAYLLFDNEVWIGFYYPDENNLSGHVQSPELNSLEECRTWVNSQVQIHNLSGYSYDYECGKNCKFNKDYKLYICKETLK